MTDPEAQPLSDAEVHMWMEYEKDRRPSVVRIGEALLAAREQLEASERVVGNLREQLAQAEARRATAPNRKGALSINRMQEIAAEHWVADRHHEFWLATEVIAERKRAEAAEALLEEAVMERLASERNMEVAISRAEAAEARIKHLEQMYDDWKTDYDRERECAEEAEADCAALLQRITEHHNYWSEPNVRGCGGGFGDILAQPHPGAALLAELERLRAGPGVCACGASLGTECARCSE